MDDATAVLMTRRNRDATLCIHRGGPDEHVRAYVAHCRRMATNQPGPPRFPVMLRKMWSGGEVQAWIDQHWEMSLAADTEALMNAVREHGSRLTNAEIRTLVFPESKP